MTLHLAGYTVGANEPLNHARILWAPVGGTVTADGTGGALALNEYTAQRWTLAAGSQQWTLQLPSAQPVDCVFIAAHSLAGTTITVATSPDLAAGFTTRATVLPVDNSTIAVLFTDGAGAAISTRRLRFTITGGADRTAGIIRAGQALQMPIPIYGGHRPIVWNRRTEMDPQISETGQWLGATERRRSLEATYAWEYLRASWYATYFEPFARTLPARPFGIVGNPSALAANDVGWVREATDPQPQVMGMRDYVAVSLGVTGFWQ